ncbi:hypothetical protein A3B18_03345 [Candidatus Giovannonibacteria bacterium RIFCSPLOWO2_01_FULL_46_13]|uniref:Uncharacterized protein n=1 Tax=Candidatus Giovannonibacteria bacterium RIFCSPLOWO2_01_FULL_46_13 TaxID=1798352 RepID=A0A1F5X2I7_9BACT|nr:MAG: hypothetical protein A3B18_03345 [Candidatus Giovannonibacteria bacterium RIFCSPLOWO2_01_FULL_46_13]
MSTNNKILIIILVIILGLGVAWWYYGDLDMASFDSFDMRDSSDPSTQKLQEMSGSDETEDIEKDLNESDYSELTKELDSIEAEFEAGVAQ